ncbi:MAG TPA: hypothetical protein V6C58_27780 [Allocoleopsis sp.]
MKSRNGNIDININLQTKGIDYHHNNLKEPMQSDARPEVNVKRASVPKQLDFTYYGENPVMKAYYADMADKRLRRVAYQNRDISAIEAEPSFRRAFDVAPARERLEEVIPVPATPRSEQAMPAMPAMPATPLIEPVSETISGAVQPTLGEPVSMPIMPELGEPVSEMVSTPIMPELGEPIEETKSMTSAKTVMEPMQEVAKTPSVTSSKTVMEMPFEELRSQVPKILSRVRAEPTIKANVIEPPAWAEMLVEGEPASVMSSLRSSRPSELSGAMTAKQAEPREEDITKRFASLSSSKDDDPIVAINDFLSKQEKPIYSFKPVIQTKDDLKKFFGRMRSATLKGEAEQAYLKNLPFNEFQQRENLIGMMTGQLEEQMGRRIMPNINDIIEYRLGAYLPRGIYIDDLLPENLRDEYAKNKPRRMV